jgi:SAM-dependent methyltransferase
MGVKLQRAKPRNLLASILYRLKYLPISRERRLRFFLNLEWITDRLAHETSYELLGEEHPLRVRGVDHILGLIDPSHSVLDLGCSRGEITKKIAEKARVVVGVDHSAEKIGYAKQFENEKLSFFHGDAEEFLDSEDRVFDVLILSHVLEHLDNPAEFLDRFVPRFKYVYVEVPDFDKSIANRIRQDMGIGLIYTDDDHVTEFDREEIASLLEKSGLRILSSEHRYGVQRYWCEGPRAQGDTRG